MDLEDKLKLFRKNVISHDEDAKFRKIERKYLALKDLYKKVESDLSNGDIRILVSDGEEKRLAKQYFTSNQIACFGDCVTQFTFELTEKGIKKLEKDYLKAKEEYYSYE